MPEFEVKSDTEAVLPPAMVVLNCTVCADCESPVRVTVKVRMPPSVADVGATEKAGTASSLANVRRSENG